MGGRHWTNDEKQFVVDNCKDMNIYDLSDKLGRTFNSVKIFVNRNGIQCKTISPIDKYLKYTDLKIGQKVNSLTITGFIEKITPEGTRTFVNCTCECGKIVEMYAGRMHSGENHSCGCLGLRKMMEARTTHGLTNSPLYRRWHKMRDRCLNPKHSDYHNYGGRGITICEEWSDFKKFHDWAISHGYKKELSLDRKNCHKGYSPDNCRWSTPLEQSNNKRNNRRLTAFGETKTISEWSRDQRVAVSYSTIHGRLESGWTINDALTIPSDLSNSQRNRVYKVRINATFGCLTIIDIERRIYGKLGKLNKYCICKCECGEIVEVWAKNLLRCPRPQVCNHLKV